MCKVAVEHDDPKAFDIFLREFDAPTASMAVGTTGWFGGRRQVTPVMRVFSATIEREAVHSYEVPGLNAPNFHFLDSLGSGQFASLRLPPSAKGKAQ